MCVHARVCLDDALEREHGVDHRLQHPRLRELGEGTQILATLWGTSDEQTAAPAVGPERHPDRVSEAGDDETEPTLGCEHGCAAREGAVPDGVEDHVPRLPGLGEVLPGVVDHVCGAERPDEWF